jgi:hypothetical protein
MVLGLGVASFGVETLSGSWDTTITIVPTPLTLGIESNLEVTYSVSGWAFTSITGLTDAGWDTQTFGVTGSLGAFVLTSLLTFDPTAAPDFFDSWVVTTEMSIIGVMFDVTFTLDGTGTALDLGISIPAGSTVDVTVDVSFGDPLSLDCDFDWQGIDITVDFPFNCALVSSTISFDCDGFNYVEFTVQSIAIPTLPWLSLDATLLFTVQTKTLTLTPVIDFGPTLCFDLYLDMDGLASVGPAVNGWTNGLIWINGIGLEVEFGDVVFTGLSYWGPDPKPGLLKGTDYWEVYQISTSDSGCCGGTFDFSIAVFFLENSLNLFDVSFVQADMSVNVTDNFVFSTGISVDLDAVGGAFTLWTIGFAVTW